MIKKALSWQELLAGAKSVAPQAGIGAGLGALLTGGTSAMAPTGGTETPAERRRRVLRNTLLGAVAGGGIGAAFPAAASLLSNSGAPRTAAFDAGEEAQGIFASGQPASSWYGRLMMGGLGYGADRAVGVGIRGGPRLNQDTAHTAANDIVKKFEAARGAGTAAYNATIPDAVAHAASSKSVQAKAVAEALRRSAEATQSANAGVASDVQSTFAKAHLPNGGGRMGQASQSDVLKWLKDVLTRDRTGSELTRTLAPVRGGIRGTNPNYYTGTKPPGWKSPWTPSKPGMALMGAGLFMPEVARTIAPGVAWAVDAAGATLK